MDGKHLTLPSGHEVLARQISLNQLTISESIRPWLDGDMDTRNRLSHQIAFDPGFSELLDQSLCLAVIEPTMELPPEEPSDRSADVVYTDEVDEDDRCFVFLWALGTDVDVSDWQEE